MEGRQPEVFFFFSFVGPGEGLVVYPADRLHAWLSSARWLGTA